MRKRLGDEAMKNGQVDIPFVASGLYAYNLAHWQLG